jgi:phosphoribosylformylglycinamidine cyclo-ligase
MDHVDYDTLDTAKNAFIAACKRTTGFAKKYGFIPDGRFGASANVFELDLSQFIENGSGKLHLTLVPEGLGTADDAHPEDMSEEEAIQFWYNIGIKTMGVMSNDAASSGMQTILISLYLPSSTPELLFNEVFLKGFLDGFVDGCEKVGCVYFSGETPQLKTKIVEKKLDIAGACFGLMPAGIDPVDGSKLAAGNTMVFIGSTGPDANGYTSLRDLATRLENGYRTQLPSGEEYWKAINNPTVLITPLIQKLFKEKIPLTNIEPISGHGWQKIMRSSAPLRYVVEDMIEVPEIFNFVAEQTNTSPAEMIKIFNYGLGFVLFIDGEEQAKETVRLAKEMGLEALVGGYVEEAEVREVQVKPLDTTLTSENFLLEQ